MAPRRPPPRRHRAAQDPEHHQNSVSEPLNPERHRTATKMCVVFFSGSIDPADVNDAMYWVRQQWKREAMAELRKSALQRAALLRRVLRYEDLVRLVTQYL